MLPSFSPASIRGFIPTFNDCAARLSLRLLDAAALAPDGGVLDVPYFVGKATLDAIGLTGFDWSFDALGDQNGELERAFRAMFDAAQNSRIGMFALLVPLFQGLVRALFSRLSPD